MPQLGNYFLPRVATDIGRHQRAESRLEWVTPRYQLCVPVRNACSQLRQPRQLRLVIRHDAGSGGDRLPQ